MEKHSVAHLGMRVIAVLILATTGQMVSAQSGEIEIFEAAGFELVDGRYIRCHEDPPTMSYQAGSIERSDVNQDGRDEAWVTEGSAFCYGNTGTFFVLLTQDADGGWKPLLEGVGVAVEQPERNHGWPDIEIGGPGSGPFPNYSFDGDAYIRN